MYAVIHTIIPFDASVGSTINFAWEGNQIHKIKCTIKDNETGITVYENTEESMKYSYALPGTSGLQNGKYYIAFITVFDVNGTESEVPTTGTPFYCFTAPVFNLSITANGIVRASTYQVDLEYSQQEQEPLDYYNISLYSYQNTLLQTSGNVYEIEDGSYTLTGLENATQYYIRATGKTVHGYQLDTGYVLFTVAYIQSTVLSTLELNNNADIGGIEIRSNILSAEGVSDKEVIYIDGTKADLRDNSVKFDIGFIIQGDYSTALVFEKPVLNSVVAAFRNQNNTMSGAIYYREGNYTSTLGVQSFMELVVNYYGAKYTIMSNYTALPTDNQQFALCVSRQNNLYDMTLILKSKEE